MSDPYTRSLTFKSNNLGKFATLVLVFDEQVDGLYVNRFPVVWRSSEFQSDGDSQVSVTYFNQPAFLKPGPLHNDIIVDVAASQALDLTQETKLVTDDIGRYQFTNPESGPPGNVTVTNGTTAASDIVLGFGQVDPNRPITPVYYWNPGAFQAGGSIESQLNSVLRAYVTDQYDDAMVVRSPISAARLFQQDLSLLDKSTVWILTYNDGTGQFEINQELA